jgi:hypothetical protein
MGQLTIYLNDDNEQRVKKAANAAGMPVSRWVAQLVEQHCNTEWPPGVRELAGSWPDFPRPKRARAAGKDTRREEL